MKICIDVRSPGKTGILTYAICLVNSLLRLDKTNEYILITERAQEHLWPPSVEKIFLPSRNPVSWFVWSNTVLPKLLVDRDVNIYHTVKHVTAVRLRTKQVLTLHGGPAVYRSPELYKWYDLVYWRLAILIASRLYDRTITDTEFEKRYLATKVGVPEHKLRVANLSADERFHVIDEKHLLEKIRSKFGLPEHFVLFVGMLHQRKNLEGVIKGFCRAKSQLNEKHKLVIVGGSRGTYTEKIKRLVSDLKLVDEVIFLGHAKDEDLPYIYNLACLFLLPSHYENFGIIFLEAMACGLPVITSKIEDIDEVVGEAALRVDARSVADISEAIVKVLNCDELMCSLIEKGLRRATLFSWERCARETLAVYEEFQ